MLFCALFVNAQWVTDTAVNTLVSDDTTEDMMSAGTSDGKTFVVYWKVVSAPTNYELRLQILDANGNQTLGSNGTLISNTIPMATSTAFWKIKVDTANNLYVSVTGTGSGTPAIVFKINSVGTLLWGSNGITVGSGYLPTVCPLANGDVLIAYWPGTKSTIQRYTSAGVAVWGTPTTIMPFNGTSATIIADMYELSNQDVIVIFNHRLGSFGLNSNLYAQKYNSSGVAQWTAPTQLSNKTTVYNRYYSGVQDGDVIYYGYFATVSSRFDSYIQRLNADGTTPWAINGLDFDTNQTNFELDTKINTTTGSNYLWAICNYTNSSQNLGGEYVQKIDKTTGTRLFTDNAKLVFPIDNNFIGHISDLKLTNDTPFFLAKIGADNGATPTTLNATKLDANGNFVWVTQYLPVATYSANKSRVALSNPINGESVAVFIEQKVSQKSIYAQKFIEPVLSSASFSTNSFKLFPNPTNNMFTIEGISPIESVIIHNSIGQEIYNAKLNNVSITNIPTHNWANGIYLVQITFDKGVINNYKLIKE